MDDRAPAASLLYARYHQMDPNGETMKLSLSLLALSLLGIAGCASTETRTADTATSPLAVGLESARVVYTQRGDSNDTSVQTAGFVSSASAPNERILAISYPHPNGDIDRALAEVVVLGNSQDENKKLSPARRVAGWFENSLPGIKIGDDGTTAYRLDLDKNEVDGLLRAMAAQGMLEGSSNSTGSDKLNIAVNGKTQQRPVARNTTLTELTKRVVSEGSVVSIDEPRVARLVESQTEVARDSFYDGLLR
jgi:hypothetical protein